LEVSQQIHISWLEVLYNSVTIQTPSTGAVSYVVLYYIFTV